MYNIYKNIEYNRKEQTMKIILIRHSEPDYSFINDNMSCQWSNLAPLTKKGIEIYMVVDSYAKSHPLYPDDRLHAADHVHDHARAGRRQWQGDELR